MIQKTEASSLRPRASLAQATSPDMGNQVAFPVPLWPDAHADGKENTRIIACRSLESVVVAMAKQPSEDGESVEVRRIDGCGRRLMRRIGA
jgi:hypothetical protein